MSNPLTVQPGPANRPGETSIASPPPPHGKTALPAPAKVIRASLRYSIKDALWWSVMQGAGASYVLPFVVLEGSGLFRLAALAGLPALATGLVQWSGANVVDRLHRRNRIIVSGASLQALSWFVFAAAIFLPFNIGYWVMLTTFIGYVAAGAFPLPAWQSLMGDLVPEHRRGRYFGLRNSLSGAVQMGAFLVAGWWLTFCEHENTLGLFGLSSLSFGFFTLFVLAGITRGMSAYYLSRVYDPVYKPEPSDRFTLLEFIRRAPRAHFGRFVIYCGLVHLAFGFNGPFFGWYLLRELGYSPGQFAVVITVSLLAGVLSQPLWGRLSDRMGSKYVLAIGGNAIVFTPLVLLLCGSFWQFTLAMIYDGVAGAAFTIAIGNYFFDVVTPPKRARCVAYNTLFLSLGGLLGAFAGATVATVLPTPFVVGNITVSHPFALMLICSAVVRLMASLLLLSTFDEFRLRRPQFS
ncbi:MAG: MFS transporter [Phycisphaerae bacterium]|nr:MFS transporter [Phycisphaerae bacterium]